MGTARIQLGLINDLKIPVKILKKLRIRTHKT